MKRKCGENVDFLYPLTKSFEILTWINNCAQNNSIITLTLNLFWKQNLFLTIGKEIYLLNPEFSQQQTSIFNVETK